MYAHNIYHTDPESLDEYFDQGYYQAPPMSADYSQQSYRSDSSEQSGNTWETFSSTESVPHTPCYSTSDPFWGLNPGQFSPGSGYYENDARTMSRRSIPHLPDETDVNWSTPTGSTLHSTMWMGGAVEQYNAHSYLELDEMDLCDSHTSSPRCQVIEPRDAHIQQESITNRRDTEPHRSGPKAKKPKSTNSFPCVHPGCDSHEKGAKFTRLTDLKRHIATVHNPQFFDCEFGWCGRTGNDGFKRHDHYVEHLREYHLKDIPKISKKKSS